MNHDKLTPNQRSALMSKIRGRDTKPELVIRRIVTALGYRYRLCVKKLPGTPDLVFTRHHKLIFVHGCFWHSHTCKRGQSTPIGNAAFWQAKRIGNVERDRRNLKELKRLGWKILIIWECATRDQNRLTARLSAFLSR